MSQITEPRFSRAFVLGFIEQRMTRLEETYGWNEGQGRVVLGDNSERDKILDFGAYEALRDLREDFQA
jgi:hypothetical protein